MGPGADRPAWDVLMKRLGYARYVSQGGDWGSVIADAMARQAPAGLLGIHVNMPPTVPAEIAAILGSGGPAPAGCHRARRRPSTRSTLLPEELRLRRDDGHPAADRRLRAGDSPVGLAAWTYDKFAEWTHSGGDPERALTRDEMLDDITLYWLTNTAISSAQLYWENDTNNFNAVEQKTADIAIPVAVTVFPGEIYRAPKTWTERAYHNLIYFNEVDKGGHFAAWEQPELFADELRAAFRSLRKSS